MEEIRYYPLVDRDETGYVKSPLFAMNEEQGKSITHQFYLQEIVPHHFRLKAQQPQNTAEAEKYTIYCPRCGKKMRLIGAATNSYTLGLYVCETCREDYI